MIESFNINDFSNDPRYSSQVARVRELEGRLIPPRTFVRMLEASADSTMLDEIRGTGYAEVLSDTPLSDGLVTVFRRVEEFRRLHLADIGIPPLMQEIDDVWTAAGKAKELIRLAASSERTEAPAVDFEPPPFLSGVLKKAIAEFMQDRSVYQFDSALDRAVSEDLLHRAETTELRFVQHFLKLFLDTRAILAAVRLQAWEKAGTTRGDRAKRLEMGTLPLPGYVDSDRIAEAAIESLERLPSIFRYTTFFESLQVGVEHYQSEGSWALLERLLDAQITSFCKQARFTPFGIEPLIAYAWFTSQEALNFRIVVSARRARIPARHVDYRLREGYDA